MSRGPGRIERALAAVFAAEPDDAFTAEDLIDRIFPGINRVEKKHRVSLIRAAKKVCVRLEGWEWTRGETLGSPVIFWNRYNVMSYAAMRLKADMFGRYRNHDSRLAWLPNISATAERR